ncbi:ATP-dependent RecD-like DNA helicase [Nocardioides aquaticus]|uniref:ATP-dependent RecD-like DNA helicase n=1 Tax=Nocardioides aquaticus TaxID=160826 RepID=A0ABX8EGG4_9ACTN|nr:AAA domain-containing protein [Nocardioides aquaticus]QVT79177.1 ATP-dependent RecD-like DNA helicase [Nocardioides aquaticus]
MKLELAGGGQARLLALPRISQAPVQDGQPVRITLTGGGIALHDGTRTSLCGEPDEPDASWLKQVAESRAYLADVITVDQGVRLRVIPFDQVDQWARQHAIGVDEHALDRIAQAVPHLQSRRPEEIRAWLTDQVRLEAPDPAVLVHVGGSRRVNVEAFRLVGESRYVDVSLVGERLLVDTVSPRRRRDSETLCLVHGSVRFEDATRLASISPADLAEWHRLTEADNSYLQVWNRYNQFEREARERTARLAGSAAYDSRRRLLDGSWEFDLVLSVGASRLIEALRLGEVTLEAGATVAYDQSATVSGAGRRTLAGTARLTETGTVVLRPEVDDSGVDLPRHGYLSGSFTADRIRLKRREEAQARAVTAKSFPVLQLSRVLAGQAPAAAGRVDRHPAMSKRAAEALGAPPTRAQVDAITIALNTPDIALIQGPPGTGKTRVIAAVNARLTQINADHPAEIRRTLLSSYQHDAVDNLAFGADDGRLPAMKVAARSGQSGNSQVAQWARATVARIDKHHAGREESRVVRDWIELRDRTTAYRLMPADVASTVEVLSWLAARSSLIGSETALDAEDLITKLNHQVGLRHSRERFVEILRRVRSLRVSPESFADDGADNATLALEDEGLRAALSEDQARLMTELSNAVDPAPHLLEATARLQADVLDRLLTSRARSAVTAQMPEVNALLQRSLTTAQERVQQLTSVADRIVEDFRRALLEQPETVASAVSTHSRALAATCQQAVAGVMKEIQASLEFDTVIVDEAARANPLDLLIPLTLARRRIILVGDHRQLPQMLDEDVVDTLENSDPEAEVKRVLEKSMFEQLFQQLRALERADGISRVVTLDQQFRTHPVLGEFVSTHFYEPYGEAFTNGRPDPTEFEHGLDAYEGRPAAWIDVPATLGPETGRSKTRRIEAEVIVRELVAALDAGRDLNFGVIAFYSGQVRAIWEELERIGYAVRDGDVFSLAPSVRLLWSEDGLERVRVGTVDAFQGREFDVVYLSATRSQRLAPRNKPRFGFLALPNRLCVAMSRQRRLLVVVGDAAMFTHDHANEKVPALAAFHQLTGGAHGCRRPA